MSMFYIGQKILAIKDHSQGMFKKGDEFTVINVKKHQCKCGFYVLNIGLKTSNNQIRCTVCKTIINNYTDINWFFEGYFAPIELSTTTFEDVIKEVEPCLN